MKASDYFHGPEGYNCAQAVLKTLQNIYTIADSTITAYAKFGGGRADNGLCGALFALHHVIKTPEQIAAVNSDFEKYAGSTKCKEIKKLNRLSCKGCVNLSIEILKLPYHAGMKNQL